MEIARHMLHQKELPKKSFKHDCFHTKQTSYTSFAKSNFFRTLGKGLRLTNFIFLRTKTEQKILELQNTYSTFLEIFGCLCYSHVLQVKCDKLDKKVELGVFVTT
ncbi:hypothetical protein CR513_46994, partial [Mucuna pruriens]